MMVSEVLTFFLGFYVWRHFAIDEIRYTEIDGAIEVATEFQDQIRNGNGKLHFPCEVWAWWFIIIRHLMFLSLSQFRYSVNVNAVTYLY